MRRVVCLIISAGLLVGCQAGDPSQQISLDVRDVQSDPSVAELAEVLGHCIDGDGFVDVEKYQSVAATLERQLQRWAVTGPSGTPRWYPASEDRLAYWLNARAGWSLFLGMQRHAAGGETAENLTAVEFPLDGRGMTLSQIDGRIEQLGGPTAVIASPGIDLHRAKLPQRPFSPDGLTPRLQRRVLEFIDDEKRFHIDFATQTIRFPRVIWQYRESILESYIHQYGRVQPTLTTALLPLVTGPAHRRLQDAIGYATVEDTRPGSMSVKKW